MAGPTIDIDRYQYTLPEEAVAKYPLPRREHSRLLLYNKGETRHHRFEELPDLLPSGSWLVLNNTRVIQARLDFTKATGARIEVFCLEPVHPVDYQMSLQSTTGCRWKCLVGNARKWKTGAVSLTVQLDGKEVTLQAEKAGKDGDNYLVDFHWDSRNHSFGEIMEQSGSTPIPPYLKRKAERSDRERYQTVYSLPEGSVAAPTAGLHFSHKMWKSLKERGIRTGELTLHVGAGTFVPVKTEDARQHRMHREKVSVPIGFLEQWQENPSGVIAVGTTTTRSLESLYWLGVKLCSGETLSSRDIHLEQWENERLPDQIPLRESQQALIGFCSSEGLDTLPFSTQLMIVPGYKFRSISGLVTNYHLPGSTLLLLIAAFIGDDWRKVYDQALKEKYRFLSYGDSSLLLPRD
jgi:S-adenosylmethionine:tRNA ribosyltransferase-isomerase